LFENAVFNVPCVRASFTTAVITYIRSTISGKSDNTVFDIRHPGSSDCKVLITFFNNAIFYIGAVGPALVRIVVEVYAIPPTNTVVESGESDEGVGGSNGVQSATVMTAVYSLAYLQLRIFGELESGSRLNVPSRGPTSTLNGDVVEDNIGLLTAEPSAVVFNSSTVNYNAIDVVVGKREVGEGVHIVGIVVV
jgi:hypothetical protein